MHTEDLHSWQTPPDVPERDGPLDFRRVRNVPSVVFEFEDGQETAVPFFLVKGGLRKTLDEIRRQPDSRLYSAIIRKANIALPELEASPDELYPLVETLARLWWYELVTAHGAVDEEGEPLLISVPERLLDDTGRAYQLYLGRVSLKKKQVTESRPPRAAKRSKKATFGVTGAGVVDVRGKRRKVYDAAVAVSAGREDARVPEDELVAEARKQGYATTYHSYEYAVRWDALQLVKSGHLYVVGDQSEIPGTPKMLPKS